MFLLKMKTVYLFIFMIVIFFTSSSLSYKGHHHHHSSSSSRLLKNHMYSKMSSLARKQLKVYSNDNSIAYHDNELPQPSIISPFVDENLLATTTEHQETHEILDLNLPNVDNVLNLIRPFLIKDGGNVSVTEVNIENRTIVLSLQGACGSCPSSTTTMKMGVEKVLHEHFQDIKEIIALSAKSLPPQLTMITVLKQLEPVIAVITKFGEELIVKDVNSSEGQVYLAFSGGYKVKKAIESFLKEDRTVKEVIFEEFQF